LAASISKPSHRRIRAASVMTPLGLPGRHLIHTVRLMRVGVGRIGCWVGGRIFQTEWGGDTECRPQCNSSKGATVRVPPSPPGLGGPPAPVYRPGLPRTVWGPFDLGRDVPRPHLKKNFGLGSVTPPEAGPFEGLCPGNFFPPFFWTTWPMNAVAPCNLACQCFFDDPHQRHLVSPPPRPPPTHPRVQPIRSPAGCCEVARPHAAEGTSYSESQKSAAPIKKAAR